MIRQAPDIPAIRVHDVDVVGDPGDGGDAGIAVTGKRDPGAVGRPGGPQSNEPSSISYRTLLPSASMM